jgi:hypothetical protein
VRPSAICATFLSRFMTYAEVTRHAPPLHSSRSEGRRAAAGPSCFPHPVDARSACVYRVWGGAPRKEPHGADDFKHIGDDAPPRDAEIHLNADQSARLREIVRNADDNIAGVGGGRSGVYPLLQPRAGTPSARGPRACERSAVRWRRAGDGVWCGNQDGMYSLREGVSGLRGAEEARAHLRQAFRVAHVQFKTSRGRIVFFCSSGSASAALTARFALCWRGGQAHALRREAAQRPP